MGRHDEDSSTSSSISELEVRRKDKKRRRRHHHHHRDKDDGSADRRRSSKTSHKKSSSSKKKRRRRDYDSSSSSNSDDDHGSSGDDSSRYDRRRRAKKRDTKKKNKKKHKKSSRRSSSNTRDDKNNNALQDRNYALADALYHLVEHHPAMGADLPIILVRLANGTTFDLRQMPPAVNQALATVLQCLAPFGVAQEPGGGAWGWTSPTGKSAHTNTNELVLVRIVRAMLDQIGLTMEAMEEFENPKEKKPPVQQQQQQSASSSTENTKHNTTTTTTSENYLEDHVKRILDSFDTNALSTELAGLCTMILEGESIALDGLPDPTLRTALEGLLEACGLVRAEMEPDDDDDDDDGAEATDNEPSLGYALSEEQVEHAQQCLTRVKRICETIAARPSRIQGPKRPPTSYQQSTTREGNLSDEDDDDEIGPSVVPRDASSRASDHARAIEAQAA
eukprot:scaffold14229_cov92-Amphora_coffeaeformis.AAC.1